MATTAKKAVKTLPVTKKTPPAAKKIQRTTLNAKRLQQMPELYKALTDTAAIVELELRQGLAALHDPAQFPVAVGSSGAAPSSIAQVAQRWAAGLSAGDRRRATRAAAESLPPALATVADRYQLDLRSAQLIHRQLVPPTTPKPGAEAVVRQLTQLAQAQGLTERPARPAPAGRRAAPPMPGQDVGKLVQLIFRMNALRCLEDTTERFRDEISISGVASDDEGQVVSIDPLFLGRFKKGDVKTFDPPKPLATLSLTDFLADFPHTLQASVVLSELELPRLTRAQDTLVKLFVALFVGGFAVEGIALVLSILIVTAGIVVLPAPVVLALGVTAGAVAIVGLLLAALFNSEAMNPEVFPAQAAVVTLPDNITGFDGGLISPLASLDFEAFGGHYRLDYTFELIKEE